MDIVVPEGCNELYYLAYPLGFAISFVVHLTLNKLFPPPGLGQIDPMDYYNTFTPEEAAHVGIEPYDGRIEGQDINERDIFQERIKGVNEKF